MNFKFAHSLVELKRVTGSAKLAGYAFLFLVVAGVTNGAPPDITGPLFGKGAIVLFQGDSITDMGRGRTADPNHLLGHGYAFLVSASQAEAYPGLQVTFINRGISGNTSHDLVTRWQADALDFRPDVLSILIGVNDVGHKLRDNQPFLVEDYEATYEKLLSDTFIAIPNAKLILGEPFCALGKGTVAHYDQYAKAIQQEDEVVDRLAIKYHAAVVRYPKMFQEAYKRAPVDYWIWDGVHPTYAGQQLMAYEWERTYRAFFGPPASK